MGQVTRTNYGCSKITTFNNAEIKALPGTLPILVPAVLGKIILPHIVAYKLAPWVADYTNIDGASNVSVNVNPAEYPVPTLTGAGLLAQGQANVIWGEYSREFDFTPFDMAALISKPLLLVVTNGVAGPFTGGNATTVLAVQVFYDVI